MRALARITRGISSNSVARRRAMPHLHNPIRACSSNFAPRDADDRVVPNRMPQLLEWLDINGARFRESVDVSWVGKDVGGYRLTAKVDLDEGDRVIELPPGVPLTLCPKSDPPQLTSLVEQVPEELWGARLGLRLLLERALGTRGRHCEYVSNLPTAVQGVPMFFGQEAIEAIQYPPVLQQVNLRSQFLVALSQNKMGDTTSAMKGTQVDINALGWGMAATLSRAFRLRGPDEPGSLLPLIDMCNHSFKPNCEVKPGLDGEGAVLRALKPIEMGDELLICYGPSLNNDDLFLDYGFIIDPNLNDGVELSFSKEVMERARIEAGLPPILVGEELWRDSAYKAMGLDPLTRNVPIPGITSTIRVGGATTTVDGKSRPLGVDATLIGACRVVAADQPEALRRLSASDLMKLNSESLSASVDSASMKVLGALVQILLKNLPTTLNSDLKWLENNPVDAKDDEIADPMERKHLDDMRLAVRFRAAKKRSLLRVLVAATGRLAQLRG